MREILFRGKNIDLEWVEGDLLQNGVDYKTAIRDYEERLVERVISHTVGQYTGLTDKNGKKIFEGDIVRTLAPCSIEKYTKGVVMFGEYSTSYQSSNIGYYVNWPLNKNLAMYCKMNDIEVIGNIHDNPELLKREG